MFVHPFDVIKVSLRLDKLCGAGWRACMCVSLHVAPHPSEYILCPLALLVLYARTPG
jgi:hypothetical protein